MLSPSPASATLNLPNVKCDSNEEREKGWKERQGEGRAAALYK